MRVQGAIVAVYVAAGFLTYGYVFNRVECQPDERLCEGTRGAPALIAAAGWPAYWLGKGAIHVTKQSTE